MKEELYIFGTALMRMPIGGLHHRLRIQVLDSVNDFVTISLNCLTVPFDSNDLNPAPKLPEANPLQK